MKKVFFLPVIIFSFAIKIIFAQGGCWSTKASLSVARTLVSVVEIKGVIYAIGGSLSGHLSTAVVEAYDTTTGNWNFRTNLPIPLCAAATCVYENKIYVFGGFPYGEAGLTALDSVYEYDPPLNLWTKKTSLPIKVGAAIAQTVNNKIYIIGGCDGNLSNVYHSVYEYDPISEACKTKRDMPTAR